MSSKVDRASRRLKERDFKLNTLLEVSSAINNQDTDQELFDKFLVILTDKLGLGKGALLSNISGWSVNLQFGDLNNFDTDALIKSCFEYNRITVLNDVPDPNMSSFDVLIPIFHKSKPISYLLLGDFEGEKIEVSPIIRHLPFIQTLTNLIVVAQENRRLFNENLRQAALRKELELAQKMQNLLIPEENPDTADLDIYALYQPHQEVGGDYYDYFQISEEETVFCMADVSGKGISAALLMSNFQAMMHAILEYDKNLEKLVRSLNNRLLRNTNGEKFITAFIGKYNHVSHVLEYVNCGHQPAVLYNDGEVLELSEGTSVLGAIDELPHLNIGLKTLLSGSTMLTFTDGICELENEKREEFGLDGIKGAVQWSKNEAIDKIIHQVMDAATQFKGKMSFNDDFALMGVRITH